MNLISNSGFETDTSGWNSGGDSTLSRSTDQAKFGAASLKSTASATGSGMRNMAFTSLNFTAEPHTASFWIYIPSSWTGGEVTLELANLTGVTGTTSVAANMSATDVWQQVTLSTFTPDADDLAGAITVRAAAITDGEFIHIDGARAAAGEDPFHNLVPAIGSIASIPELG